MERSMAAIAKRRSRSRAFLKASARRSALLVAADALVPLVVTALTSPCAARHWATCTQSTLFSRHLCGRPPWAH
eukprot:9482422-Pyramimonas_sp.AAC.1